MIHVIHIRLNKIRITNKHIKLRILYLFFENITITNMLKLRLFFEIVFIFRGISLCLLTICQLIITKLIKNLKIYSYKLKKLIKMLNTNYSLL